MEFITLKNEETETIIEGIVMHPLKINKDESGILVETLRKDWPVIYGKDREFAMQYYSVTPPGLARDEDVWHCHPTIQEDRFLVISGEIVVAVADNRKGSKTNGLLNLFYMKPDEDPFILLIPRGTLHGFMALGNTPAMLLNFPTAIYNPAEESRVPYSEAQVKFDDGTLFSWDRVRKQFAEPSSSNA